MTQGRPAFPPSRRFSTAVPDSKAASHPGLAPAPGPLRFPLRFLPLVFFLGTTSAASQTDWTLSPQNPVLARGTAGEWDYSWIASGSVVWEDSQYTLWYSGSPDGQRPRIGRAISRDGIMWQKDSLNPVFQNSPPPAWDEDASFNPRVLRRDSSFLMVYAGMERNHYGATQLGLATSNDGRLWKKDTLNPALTFGGAGSWDESYLDPMNVLFDGTMYHMWYTGGTGGGFPGTTAAIGYASSIDGVHWAKDARNPVLTGGPPGSWDERGIGLGWVICDSGIFHMWYVGNVQDWPDAFSGIGYAVSRDGIHWDKYPANPVFVPRAGPALQLRSVYYPIVLPDASGFRMWFTGDDWIGLATSVRASASITLTDSVFDFQNVRPGSADTLIEVVGNWGFTPLTVTSISLSGNEFAILDPPAIPLTLPPFTSVPIRIVFRPNDPGVVHRDSVVFVSNDTHRPVVTVSLRGRDSAPVHQIPWGKLYGIASDRMLYEIDRRTGTTSLIGSFSPDPPENIQACAVRPSDNILYGAQTGPAGTWLYQLGTDFGDVEPAGSIPLGRITSMTFGPTDDLYLADADGNLFRCAGIAGAPNFVGKTGHVFTGLALSHATGILWGTAHDSVFTIDPLSGVATLVRRTGWNVRHPSIASNPAGGMYVLYGNTLLSLDRVTGQVTEIGTTGDSPLAMIAMRTDIPSSNEDPGNPTPAAWRLLQNFPNPFNPATTIRYEVPSAGYVRLVVFDLLGREVAVLVDEEKAPGTHEVQFDASGLATGVYLYRLTAGSPAAASGSRAGSSGFVQSRKMIVVK